MRALAPCLHREHGLDGEGVDILARQVDRQLTLPSYENLYCHNLV